MRSRYFVCCALLGACARAHEAEERAVVVYAPVECAIPEASAYAVLYPEGDHEPSPDASNASFFLRDRTAALAALSPDMRSLVVDVSDSGGGTWRGLSSVPPSGDVNVLLWPLGKACRLSGDFESRSGAAMASLGGEQVMLVGGAASGRVPSSFVTDLRTGITSQLARGLGSGRVNPSMTSFVHTDGRLGALVSGGMDPEANVPLSDVEVYVGGADGALGDFDNDRITLGSPRSNHAAVMLASGETALIGGTGRNGASASIEVVDGALRRARTAGVALLESARTSPRAVRLVSGEVLVAGGADANGQPVARVEWLSSDVSRASKRSREIAPGEASDLVALSAGGALYVVKRSGEDAADGWRIGNDGSIASVGRIANMTHVALASSDRGGALLYTGNRWLSFDPWGDRFVPNFDLPDLGGPVSSLVLAPDPGLVLWGSIESGTLAMRGARHSIRSAFSFVAKPLLRDDIAAFAPDGSPGSRVVFQSSRGLVLSNGGAAFLTDVTFANASVSFDVVDVAPLLIMRDERGAEAIVGEGACAWKSAPKGRVTVQRREGSIRVSLDSAEEAFECTAPWSTGRISFGFRAPVDAASVGVTNVIVTRE